MGRIAGRLGLRYRGRKTRRGSLETPSSRLALWMPDKRPDESGRGRQEFLRHAPAYFFSWSMIF